MLPSVLGEIQSDYTARISVSGLDRSRLQPEYLTSVLHGDSPLVADAGEFPSCGKQSCTTRGKLSVILPLSELIQNIHSWNIQQVVTKLLDCVTLNHLDQVYKGTLDAVTSPLQLDVLDPLPVQTVQSCQISPVVHLGTIHLVSDILKLLQIQTFDADQLVLRSDSLTVGPRLRAS